MCKMLLSINPQFCEEIFGRRKLFEFRKVQCRHKVEWILIYETAPTKMVVGEARIIGVVADTPEKVWKCTEYASGITKSFFDRYYRGKTKAVAYKLGEVTKYDEPIPLSDYGIKQAPQSFMYI